MLPLGLLYVAGIVERAGYKVKIIDLYLDDIYLNMIDNNGFSNVFKEIEEFKPSIIGFGGIATSYGRAKRLSIEIKKILP